MIRTKSKLQTVTDMSRALWWMGPSTKSEMNKMNSHQAQKAPSYKVRGIALSRGLVKHHRQKWNIFSIYSFFKRYERKCNRDGRKEGGKEGERKGRERNKEEKGLTSNLYWFTLQMATEIAPKAPKPTVKNSCQAGLIQGCRGPSAWAVFCSSHTH